MAPRKSHLLLAVAIIAPLWVSAVANANGVGSIVEEAGSYLAMIEKTAAKKSTETVAIMKPRKISASWPFHRTIRVASTDFRIPDFVIAAVVKCESNWDPKARSTAGARGLMQIMPATASGEFGISSHRLWNPLVNVYVGTAYLKQLFDRYQGDWSSVLAAYNAGPSRVDGGRRLPRETIRYRRCVAYWVSRYREVSYGRGP